MPRLARRRCSVACSAICASNNSIWLYDDDYANYLVKFTSDDLHSMLPQPCDKALFRRLFRNLCKHCWKGWKVGAGSHCNLRLWLAPTKVFNHNTVVYQYRSCTQCRCIVLPAHHTHSVIHSVIQRRPIVLFTSTLYRFSYTASTNHKSRLPQSPMGRISTSSRKRLSAAW